MSQPCPNSLPYGQGGARVPSALMQKGINFANQLDQDTLIKLIKSATAPIVIAPKVGNTIDVDAYALGQLAKILEKKDTSIFDVIIGYDGYNRSKIIGIVNVNTYYSVATILAEDLSTNIYTILYTSTQYEGLAAVQEAGEAQYPGEGLKGSLPILGTLSSYLCESTIGYEITDPEGHKISFTLADGKLATVAVSEEIDQDDSIKVPFEEIQKLIGLPVTAE